MPGYKKTNYSIKAQEIQLLENKLKRKHFELYGSPTSPFYGLKNPSLPKIIEYLCDTYKLPYDVMMNMVYEKIVRDYFDKSVNLIGNYGFTRDQIRCKFHLKRPLRSKRGSWCYGKLYLGTQPYKSFRVRGSHRGNYVSGITIHTQKSLKEKYDIDDYEIFNSKYNKDRGEFDYISDKGYIRLYNKKDIILELDRMNVKCHISSTKKELMYMLMNNSGIKIITRN